MKKFTIIIITLLSFLNAEVILQESFEGNFPPENWTILDNDGDNYNWSNESDSYLDPHSGSKCAYSYSVDPNEMTALTPDNYLISPKVKIPLNGELNYYVASGDNDYVQEFYYIKISSIDTAPSSFTTILYQEQMFDAYYQYRTIDLSVYAGQEIYIAWIHTNCSDKWALKIDDISISGDVPVNLPPSTIAIPAQSISNTNQFTPIQLDEYVTDPDNSDAEITWNASGNTDLIITIENRIASINFSEHWIGSEDITFTAKDPQGLESSTTVTLSVFSEAAIENNTPQKTELLNCYPNPFNPSTTLNFSMLNNELVTASLYNTKGQMVKKILNKKLESGYHSLKINAGELTSGIYLLRMKIGDNIFSKNLNLLK